MEKTTKYGIKGLKWTLILFCAILISGYLIHIYERNNYPGCSFDCKDCTKNVTSYGVKAPFLLEKLDDTEELVEFGKYKGYPDGCVYTGRMISCYRYFGKKTESEKFSVMVDFAEYLIHKYN